MCYFALQNYYYTITKILHKCYNHVTKGVLCNNTCVFFKDKG